MTVRIAAQFTKDERDRNGLIPAAGHIVANSHDWSGFALVRLDCVRVTEEVQEGLRIPTVGIKHIELIPDDQVDDYAKTLATMYEARTGRTPLPLDDLVSDGQDADLLDDAPSSPTPDEWLDNGKGGK